MWVCYSMAVHEEASISLKPLRTDGVITNGGGFLAIRIANIWDTRFHRKGARWDTKGWMFYISRPTLEKLRKTGTDGARYYELLKETVKNFLDDHTLPKNSQSYDGDFFIQTKLSKQSPGHFATVAYPFDISSEVDKKYGVVLHLGDGRGEAEEEILKLDKITGRSEYYSMFDSRLDAHLNKRLKGAGGMVHPPGLSGKGEAKIDPMWKEFSQAKLLPTDQLLDPDIKQGNFRNIISHQYIEVRLNRFQTTQATGCQAKNNSLPLRNLNPMSRVTSTLQEHQGPENQRSFTRSRPMSCSKTSAVGIQRFFTTSRFNFWRMKPKEKSIPSSNKSTHHHSSTTGRSQALT